MDVKMRRVVTGHSETGKSIFLSDGQPMRVVTFDNSPGTVLVELWATEDTPNLPVTQDIDPTVAMTSFVPGTLGTRFRMVRFPPTQEVTDASPNGFNPLAFEREFAMKAPGLAEAFEADNAGFHTTQTIDYGIGLSGELWLELDDGSEVHLKPGDCVIQNGTRHAWHNRGREACLMVFVMIGATQGLMKTSAESGT